MRLQTMVLRNFKGVSHYELTPKGEDITVAGNNATGKTTIFDAFQWCLFGKDSLGRSDFNVKPLNEDMTEKHHLETEVELVFVLDGGREWSVTRTLTENWVKKRGSADSEFEGNVSAYKVRGVPVLKKEFEAETAKVCPEDRFRLLTNPLYFCSDLSWQKRREMLLDACGDVSDEDVILSDDRLAALPAILAGNSIDDHKKILAGRKPKVSEELKAIPHRIDEASRSIPAELPAAVDTEPLKAALDAAREERTRIRSGGEVSELTSALRTLEGELTQISNAAAEESGKEYQKALAVERAAAQAYNESETTRATKARELQNLRADLTNAESRKARLLSEYKAESAKEFTWTGTDSCGACGQSLPADQVAKARETAEGNFNQLKATKVEEILNQGTTVKRLIEELAGKIKDAEADLASHDQIVAQFNAAHDEARAKTESLKNSGSPSELTENPAYLAKQSEIEALKAKINELRESNVAALDEADQKVVAAEGALNAALESNALHGAKAKAETRIKELEEEHKGLARDLEVIEQQVSLIEDFIRAKVSLLTEKINNRFALVRWQLFETQINGGLKEVCEATVGGIPYRDLNHGMKINAGLDVINTFAQHYEFAPPVFIDNAESITAIAPTEGQQIRLLVSEKHSKLTVLDGPLNPTNLDKIEAKIKETKKAS